VVTVELVPFLAQLRDLYTQPRGFARFQEYLNILRTETGEMELPISNVNPMAKPHVLARVEELLALGAETVALEAAREGSRRLGDLDESLPTTQQAAGRIAHSLNSRIGTRASIRCNEVGSW
jgi:hypothetical protein